ncbi:MAG: hypothetical protein U9N11_01315 [Campylobacterota bacterium]|nr:hypothetical protein [Campylobacterota bacterium]
MKKLLFVSMLLGSTFLMGQPSDKMKKTMESLEVSMAYIQKGFLYNHRGRIHKGISTLREELKNIDSFIIKNESDKQFNAQAYAVNETKALDLMASRILEGFDKGQKESVLLDFQQMLNRCVTCHALVRKW